MFKSNLRFSGELGSAVGNDVLREAIRVADNPEHKRILEAILEIQEMGSLIKDSFLPKTSFHKSENWDQVGSIVQPFRRAAPHCFHSRNYSAFSNHFKSAQTIWRAELLAEKLEGHIRQSSDLPKDLKDIQEVTNDLRDAWYQDFKVDRTETEIIVVG